MQLARGIVKWGRMESGFFSPASSDVKNGQLFVIPISVSASTFNPATFTTLFSCHDQVDA